ncbi:MAG: [FeFe] hydrogenase H-cluster radical SAM maturase HydG [Proteobacteria bacterium]|nr:[FeFe] hydrogenase H-cluster radical SAM maturase HydG [Pseudomonadota bacterium]
MLDFKTIEELSKENPAVGSKTLEKILSKALNLEPLSLEEITILLNIDKAEELELLRDTADKIKRKIFGKRIVLFAPLYLSNECVNKCLYCGFQNGNPEEKRKTLTKEEALKEAKFLVSRGFKRALLVLAENKSKCGLEYIKSVVREIYKETGMRILHINSAPMEVYELKELKREGLGVFQVFQETYHKETYEKLHVKGRKADFNYRLTCMDRAITAGFKDVGIGCLLGLYDYRFDVLATISHARYLKESYGTYPHTISVPRFRYAKGAVVEKPLYAVDDFTFKKIVAVYRLAVPTAGIVISTREPAYLRDEILYYGASQISAESKTSPGGYTDILEEEKGAQFSLNDKRSLEEVVISILERGFLPSFCTACYGKGRVGEHFHRLAEEEVIKDFCEKNAISTFLEYLSDIKDKSLREKITRFYEKLIDDKSTNTEKGALI